MNSGSGYGIYGGVKLETIQPGTGSKAPTMAPTIMSTPGSLDSLSHDPAVHALHVHGVQFDMENLLDDDIVVTNFGVAFEAPGTYSLEVWSREGSHEGSAGGCDNWNNRCLGWTKLATSTVSYSGSGLVLTQSSAPYLGIAKASSTTSFVIVSGDGKLITHAGVESPANGE